MGGAVCGRGSEDVRYRSRCSRYNVWGAMVLYLDESRELLASLLDIAERLRAGYDDLGTGCGVGGGWNIAGGVSGEMGIECVEVAVGGGRGAILAWLVMARYGSLQQARRSRLDAAGSAYSHGSRRKTRRIRLDAHKGPTTRSSTAPSYSWQYGSIS
jgi:hypothetical protein